MRALDLFCCAGGASDGLVRAGFEVDGVDIEDQPEYPHHFTKRDALAISIPVLQEYDFIWASPPCQRFTAYQRRKGHVKDPGDLIPATRNLLIRAGVPFVIENVNGAPLHWPTVLCGSMFGLDVQRHRLFESNFPLPKKECDHSVWTPRFPGATNRKPNSRKTVEVGVRRIRLDVQLRAMGMRRAVSREKLSQMVPPAYAEFLGLHARMHIMTTRASGTGEGEK